MLPIQIRTLWILSELYRISVLQFMVLRPGYSDSLSICLSLAFSCFFEFFISRSDILRTSIDLHNGLITGPSSIIDLILSTQFYTFSLIFQGQPGHVTPNPRFF